MTTVKYVHWQDGDAWLGYLMDYPDDWTQGETLDDLLEHLLDLHRELPNLQASGERKLPGSFPGSLRSRSPEIRVAHGH